MASFDQLYSFQPSHKLGEGAYGIVFRGQNKLTRAPVAIKQISLQGNNEKNEKKSFLTLREISMLKELQAGSINQHPNVIRLENVFTDVKHITLVFECANTNLGRLVHQTYKELLSNDILLVFTKQIISGLKYIHSKYIMHRDLKLDNILVFGDISMPTLKIADFGLARNSHYLINSYTPSVGTPSYRAPELILQSLSQTTAVDIWSLGCILYELATKKPLFDCKKFQTEFEQLQLFFQLLGTLPTENEFDDMCGIEGFTLHIYNEHASSVEGQDKSQHPPSKNRWIADEYLKNRPTWLLKLLKHMIIFYYPKRWTSQQSLTYLNDLDGS